MKTSLLLLFAILLSHSSTCGQGKKEKEYRPFSLLIIMPDSISLDESLKPLVDTVESDFRKFYYSFIEHLEALEQFQSQSKRQEIKYKIQRGKSAEMDIHNTRYYQLIPMLTCAQLWDLFAGESNPEFSFDYISKDELFSYDLSKIANYYRADYVVTYKQIATRIKDGEPVLRIEIELFANKESKIIFNNVSYGQARFYKDNYGVLRACSNDLECLLESGMIASTRELSSFLRKRQKR